MRGAICIWQRDMIVLFRSFLSEMVTVISSPVTFILIFAFGLGGLISDIDGIPYVNFVVPGLIAMTSTLGAFEDGAWSTWFHRVVQGTIREYRVNPITVYDIVIGKILSGFTKGFIDGVIVSLIVAVLVDFRPPLQNVLLYIVFLFWGAAFFSCLGVICGTVFDKPESLGRIQSVVIMPLILLAGVFFPITSYPRRLQDLIKLLPTTSIYEGSRGAILNGNFHNFYILDLMISTMLCFIVAVIVFNRKIED